MRFGFIRTLVIVAALVLPATAFAQFGHPFNSPYSGGWGKDNVTINSNGVTLSITNVDFDYANPDAWKVTIKAEGKDATGKAVQATAVGTLENVGVYYKIFRGTWTQGAQKGDFIVTRN